MISAAWMEAIRVRTLPASIVPVLIGASIAFRNDALVLPVTALTILCALLIQTGTNFANDYYDYVRGADTRDRVGFKRASSTGEIAPEHMKSAAFVTFLTAFIIGLLLVWYAGWPILWIGMASIIAGFLYTGGPYPLAYNGLGDVFVFVFFGLVAVSGTYYVNTQQWTAEVFIAAVAIGALSTMILVVNNYRDVHTDNVSQKKTLVVIFGERFARFEYLFLSILAFSVPFLLFFFFHYSASVFLPVILLPWGIYIVYRFWSEPQKQAFNNILVQTALFMALFGLLFSLGLSVS